MFRIYIPEHLLQQIELDELDVIEHSSLYKILHSSPLGTYKMELMHKDYYYEGFDDNFGPSEEMYGTNLADDKTDFIALVTKDLSKIKDNPCGYYILDILPEKAEMIRNDWGILCFSIDEKLSTKHIDRIEISKSSEEGEEMSWEKTFPLGEIIPSNSLIISDRNLFSRVYGEFPKNLIYENIKSIIASMRWKSFKGVFSVLIIFDEASIKDEDKDYYSFDNITEKLEKIRRDLSGDSENMTVELLSISSPKQREANFIDRKRAHNKTHDRRILSNYFCGEATLRFIAFKNGKCLHGQRIGFMTLFSRGLDVSYSDCPIEEHNRMYKDLLFIRDVVKNNSEFYKYSINGQRKAPLRMLNSLLNATEL